MRSFPSLGPRAAAMACWRLTAPAGERRNCEPLLTTPAFDGLLRHPKLLRAAEALLGGPVVLAESCLRYMAPQTTQSMQRWCVGRPSPPQPACHPG